jgi:hypothetical protein
MKYEVAMQMVACLCTSHYFPVETDFYLLIVWCFKVAIVFLLSYFFFIVGLPLQTLRLICAFD